MPSVPSLRMDPGRHYITFCGTKTTAYRSLGANEISRLLQYRRGDALRSLRAAAPHCLAAATTRRTYIARHGGRCILCGVTRPLSPGGLRPGVESNSCLSRHRRQSPVTGPRPIPPRAKTTRTAPGGNESALIHFAAVNAANHALLFVNDALQMHYLSTQSRDVLAAQLNFFCISRVGFFFQPGSRIIFE